jgi:hypothetical protein
MAAPLALPPPPPRFKHKISGKSNIWRYPKQALAPPPPI